MREPRQGLAAKDAEGDPRPQVPNKGAKPPVAPQPSAAEDPPSSRRGNAFVGTNVDAAAAYVPPTELPDTGEPTRAPPLKKVSLSAEVDPRKVPTHPKMRQKLIEATGDSERPPPSVRTIPEARESQARRGAGYAPSRSSQATSQTPPLSSPKPPGWALGAAEAHRRTSPQTPAAAPRAPAKAPSAKPESPKAAESETPAQRHAALLLIFVFAALLAIAVYFFLRRAPSPNAVPPAPSSDPTASAASAEPGPSIAPSAAPSPSTPEPDPAPSDTASSAPPAPSATGSATASADATATPTTAISAPPPSPSETAGPAPSAAPTSSATSSGTRPERWF